MAEILPPAAPLAGETGEGRASEIVEVVGELYASGLITATGGNVSARVEPGSEELWITPGQMFKGRLEADSLVRIGLDGHSLDLDSRSPSSERLMHTAVYMARPEAEAVIHCHAVSATILANCDLPFLPISTEAAFFDNIPRIPFIMPGTEELAHAIGMAIGDGWAVMMKNHGLLVAGRSLRRAADMAEIIERSAEVMLGCWAVGKDPPVLPADVVQRLRQMGDLVA
jgi:autoinducer 2 (AI-2) kinase